MHDDAMIILSCLLQKGFKALHHAADNGEFATATLLLNWGADITKKENVSTHCGHLKIHLQHLIASRTISTLDLSRMQRHMFHKSS
jgi:ankyrin repeat protein